MTNSNPDNELELQFPHNVDSTMLSSYSSCPQKFFQEFILARVPIGRSIHLHAGGCVASAMENIRNWFYRDGLPLEECLERAFQKFVFDWGMVEPPDKEYKDFVNCWMVVEEYFRHYHPAADYFQPFMKTDGSPAVEFRFAIPTEVMHPETGDPILYSGRLDLLSEPHDTPGQVWAVDEKTTKSVGAQWHKQWDLRGQFIGYVYAARVLGFNCIGAVARGMAIYQTKFDFPEKPVLIPDYLLRRWWDETNFKIGRMVYNYRVTIEQTDMESLHNSWSRSYGDACTSYGQCGFVPLCTSQHPWSIYKDWETRVWNPLEKDPTAQSEDRQSALGEVSFEEAMWGL